MRARRMWWAALVAAAILLAGGAAASATDPVDVDTSHVVDPAGVLGSKTATVTKAIDTLYSNTGIDLYVVYVDAFTNPSTAQEWANATAEKNDLGPNDYLLAVATQGRSFYLSADSTGPLSDSQVAQIEQKNIEPELHKNDWAGAAIGAATGIGAAAGGGGANGWGFFWFVIIGLAVVAIILFFVLRARKKATMQPAAEASDPLAGLSLKDLERQAGGALVQTDDAIKTSGDELGFAIAQYGEAAAQPFTAVLATATDQLKQAFRLKQKLDDAIPDTDEEKRSWNAQIIHLCAEANAGLDEQANAFDELRDLGKNAPAALSALQQTAATVGARVQKAQEALVELGARYADEALATVSDNPAQATERLTFAAAATQDAQNKLDASDPGHATVGIRAAEEAVDQAGLLMDAVDRVAADLASATQEIPGVIAELSGDVAQAHAFAAAGAPGVDAAATATQLALDDANAQLGSAKPNPAAIMQRLQAANQQIDAVLQGVRDAQQEQQRAQQSLNSTLLTAQAQISAAEDFITARRGAVGADARTRLAEAGRLAVQAQATATTDPVTALAQAQRASQLAAQSIQLAQNDVGVFQGAAGDGGLFGGGIAAGGAGGGGAGGNGAMGAILGGIIINSVLGSGGGLFGGSGGSSSSGRPSGASGRGASSAGGRSAGSFGGGGTRSRRGGGRF
ncbi:MAG TPA: TPM domain-containing protein [Microbacteriaceae bacterium]